MDCYTCKYRGTVPGDRHSSCSNRTARIVANPHGVANGWCYWPYNFDPIWIDTCDGYEEKVEDES